jgi:hypothetical protein
VFTKNKALFNQGKEFVSKYVSRNISWEVQKATAIQTMTTAMTELGLGVVQAADFAGTLTGFSGQVVRRWASAFFVTLAQYPGSLDDVDDSFIEVELTSEHGRPVVIQHPLLFMMKFCLAARECIRSNAYRENQILWPMFRAWVSHKIDICDRIWENPPYGIRARFAQSVFLVAQVENCPSTPFIICISLILTVPVIYGG